MVPRAAAQLKDGIELPARVLPKDVYDKIYLGADIASKSYIVVQSPLIQGIMTRLGVVPRSGTGY